MTENERGELVRLLRDIKEHAATLFADTTKQRQITENLFVRIDQHITALSAQPEQEPVAKVKRNSGVNGREFVGETLEFRDLPVGTRLYTAPASGVQERIALQELRNIVNAKRFDVDVFDDDTAFADWAQSRARHAITSAANQVNAEGRIESLQLPPLNEIMYHAVRGLELDFGSGESLFQGSIDDDTLDLIWESINTALRCAKVSPSAPPSASQPDTVAVPRETIRIIMEVLTFLKAVLIGQGFQKDSSSINQLEIAYSMLRSAQKEKS